MRAVDLLALDRLPLLVLVAELDALRPVDAHILLLAPQTVDVVSILTRSAGLGVQTVAGLQSPDRILGHALRVHAVHRSLVHELVAVIGSFVTGSLVSWLLVSWLLVSGSLVAWSLVRISNRRRGYIIIFEKRSVWRDIPRNIRVDK